MTRRVSSVNARTCNALVVAVEVVLVEVAAAMTDVTLLAMVEVEAEG